MRLVPPADERFAKEQAQLLMRKQFESVKREIDPSTVFVGTDEALQEMSEAFPLEEPKSVKVVDFRYARQSGVFSHLVTLEYEFSKTWLLFDIGFQHSSGNAMINRMHVGLIPDSLENTNHFTLEGKTLAQYLMLLLAIAAPGFSIYVLVICLRTKNLRFKWLWAIFILVGVGQLVVNWTTGEFSFQLLSLNIPCATAGAVPIYGPWHVTVSFPLGAVLFLWRRSAPIVPEGERRPPVLVG